MRKYGLMAMVFAYGHIAMVIFTFGYLMSGARFTWWNWVIILPLDFFLSGLWPIFWVIQGIQSLIA